MLGASLNDAYATAQQHKKEAESDEASRLPVFGYNFSNPSDTAVDCISNQ
jgi:hypothetical protein